MSDKRLWWVTWAAVSGLWMLYWTGMSMALGVESVRDMIIEWSWPLLVGALVLSVPAGLCLLGTLVSCLASRSKAQQSPPKT